VRISRIATIQGFYFLANVIVSFVLLWALPIDAYAIYFFCTGCTAITAVMCDLGLSQCLVNHSSAFSQNKSKVIQLYNSAVRVSAVYSIISAALFLILFFAIGSSFSYLENNTSLIALSIFIGAMQSQLQIIRSVFIGLRDERMQAIVYLLEAGARLMLCPIIFYFSIPSVALLINLIAIIFALLAIFKIHKKLEIINLNFMSAFRAILKESIPLAPMQAYYIIQNQIPPFLIAYYGVSSDLASYGALGRILIGFSFVSIVLATYLQPIFAKKDMVQKSINLFWKTLLYWTLLSSIFLSVAHYFPEILLAILGEDYDSLTEEVFFTILVGCVTVYGVIFYCMALSFADRNSQYIAIFPCMFLQITTILSVDEFSVLNATIISLAPSLAYTVFQLIIGIRALTVPKNI
jgi:O-antigen/teichoic acid export membrane protein